MLNRAVTYWSNRFKKMLLMLMLVQKKWYYFWSCTRLLTNSINKVLKLSRNDFTAVFWEWGGICMNFPSKKTSFYSFDQFWPYWPSKTCFFRTVLTWGFNRFLPRPAKTCQPCQKPYTTRHTGIVKKTLSDHYIKSFVQDCSNSCVSVMELLQSCAKPSIWFILNWYVSCGTSTVRCLK